MLLSEQFYQTEKTGYLNEQFPTFFILKTRPERNSLTIIMIFTR